ncbi:MAG TPA: SCO family protein [Lacunisphaera sp.]|nr:SCO family protein [Lacunisphaera sp.]
MRSTLLHRLRAAALGGLICLGTVLPGTATAQASYEVTGVLREKLDPGRVLIAHDEIPGYMAAMTMAFELADPRDGAALRVGDRLRFRLQPVDDRWLVDRFAVLGSEVAPAARSPRGNRLRAGDALPPLSLRDEQNRPLTSQSFLGRFTLVTFIFTRCPVPEFCPAMAVKFGALQRELEQEKPAADGQPRTRLLSITLDPEFDRPAVLAAYGEALGANPSRWSFATGGTAEIAALARQFSVFTERNGVLLDHTLCTALIGPNGRVLEIWRGNGWTVADVLAFLRGQKEYAP